MKPPRDLASRFGPTEHPGFRLLRCAGRVRLWQSTTPTSTRYHVTKGDRCRFAHMSEFEQATANFALAFD